MIDTLRKIRFYFKFMLGYIYIGWLKIVGAPTVLLQSYPLNIAILRAFGAKVGKNVSITPPLTLSRVAYYGGYQNLTLGNNVNIGAYAFLDLRARIRMCDGVSLGPGVIIMTHNRYNKNPFLEERLASTCGISDVVLEENASIKAGALIVHGVTVGKNAVVAGHAVVNRDVPDCHFVGGIPARTIRVLDPNGEDPQIESAAGKTAVGESPMNGQKPGIATEAGR